VCALHNIVTGALDVDGRVFSGSILLDCVSLLGLYFNVALCGNFCDFTAGLTITPLPGDCRDTMSAIDHTVRTSYL